MDVMLVEPVGFMEVKIVQCSNCGGDWCQDECADCNEPHCIKDDCPADEWAFICLDCGGATGDCGCHHCGSDRYGTEY